MSFMDGFSSYNHIKMGSKDMTKATFTTEWGDLLQHSNVVQIKECRGDISKDGYILVT